MGYPTLGSAWSSNKTARRRSPRFGGWARMKSLAEGPRAVGRRRPSSAGQGPPSGRTRANAGSPQPHSKRSCPGILCERPAHMSARLPVCPFSHVFTPCFFTRIFTQRSSLVLPVLRLPVFRLDTRLPPLGFSMSEHKSPASQVLTS